MKRIISIVVLTLVLMQFSLRADYKELNEKGVKAYNRQAYDSSLQYFQGAIEENPENKVIDFNLGNVYHQQGMYQDALLSYETAAHSADSVLNAESFYNMGNTHYRAGELDKAVQAYKISLDFNPGDADTKYNLELALKRLEEQQKQQNEQNQDDKQDQKQDEQDKKEQDQKQDQKQDQRNQEQKEQKQQEQQQENQQDQEKQEQEQEKRQEEQQKDQQDQGQNQQEDSDTSSGQQQDNSQGQPPQLDEQRAQALLEGLNEDEKEILKSLIKQKIPVSSYKGKNW